MRWDDDDLLRPSLSKTPSEAVRAAVGAAAVALAMGAAGCTDAPMPGADAGVIAPMPPPSDGGAEQDAAFPPPMPRPEDAAVEPDAGSSPDAGPAMSSDAGRDASVIAPMPPPPMPPPMPEP